MTAGADDRAFWGKDLSGTRFRNVVMVDVDIDGFLSDVRVYGVDVLPLVEAELDRLHPERVLLRSDDPVEARAGWSILRSKWEDATARAVAAGVDRSIGGEWSHAQTLRHLVFATDAWVRRPVLGDTCHYWWGDQPHSELSPADAAALGLDPARAPTWEQTAAARAAQLDLVTGYLAAATADELQRPCSPPANDTEYPPASEWVGKAAASCLRVVFQEEWHHLRYALRDLATLDAAADR